MAFLVGCGGVDQGREQLAAPDYGQFPAVAEAIAPSCATLDCHGQVGRNFRFYWQRGLRLAPNASPGEDVTTDDEYRMTYRSLVALEPYRLDAVVRGQAPPESLTLVRKARGTEAHKGGAQLAIGGDADRCLVSWLANATDSEACQRAVGK
jgi:hypothetical protein